jgi:hypothetical protein
MDTISTMAITCPHCGQPSNSMKQCKLLGILFAFFFAASQTSTVNACRSCMRGKILTHAAINIVTANILFPFVILPVSIYQMIRIQQSGHDDAIIAEIQVAMRERAAYPSAGIYEKLGRL